MHIDKINARRAASKIIKLFEERAEELGVETVEVYEATMKDIEEKPRGANKVVNEILGLCEEKAKKHGVTVEDVFAATAREIVEKKKDQ